MKVRVPKLTCTRCGHRWVPKQEEVRICPACKSAYWDREKKAQELKKEEEDEQSVHQKARFRI